MKNNLLRIFALGCLLLTACDNPLNPGFDPDQYEPVVAPDPVRTLTSMASGERIVLGSSSDDIVLRWVPTERHGNTVYRYEVLFDTIGGNFTKPIEKLRADNSGLESRLSLSHYQTNAIGRIAKFRCNSNGTLRWKIQAYCGLDLALSSLEGYFNIYTMDGLDNIPDELEPVYITGEATEDRGNAANAQRMFRLQDGSYQAFLRFEAGKTYFFSSKVEEEPCTYYFDGTKLRERSESDQGLSDSPGAGIYRVTLNFDKQTCEFATIGDVYIYSFVGLHENLSYIGGGKWRLSGFTAWKNREGWAPDGEERHCFIMETSQGELAWRHKNDNAPNPGNATDPSYYNFHIIDSDGDRSHFCFRYNNELMRWGSEQNGRWTATVKTDVTLYFNTQFGAYTHRWTVSANQ